MKKNIAVILSVNLCLLSFIANTSDVLGTVELIPAKAMKCYMNPKTSFVPTSTLVIDLTKIEKTSLVSRSESVKFSVEYENVHHRFCTSIAEGLESTAQISLTMGVYEEKLYQEELGNCYQQLWEITKINYLNRTLSNFFKVKQEIVDPVNCHR
jgi:hypothetical protein